MDPVTNSTPNNVQQPSSTPPVVPITPTHTIIVNGEAKTYTTDEIVKMAQKAAGADAKFEQAAQMHKEAQTGLRLKQLAAELKTSQEVDPNKVLEFYESLGFSEEEVEALMTPEQNESQKKSQSDNTPSIVPVAQLDPRAQAALEAAERAELTRVRNEIETVIKEGVDSDEIIGKIVNRLNSDEQQRVRKTLHDMAIRDIRGRILGNEPYGPDMVKDAVVVLRGVIENLGIPSKSQAPTLGVGGSPASFTHGGIPETPVKRVPSSDPSYIENAVQRVQQMAAKAMRNR